MKRQRGQAFILVLILLAVGALVIVPTLRYTFTGLRSQRISEDALTTQVAADAALEDALWQMLNGGLLSTLNPENPEYTSDFELGLARFADAIRVQIPSVPESVWTKDKEIYVKVDVEPNWLEANAVDPSFTYIMRINSPQWDLTNFGFALPKGLTYTDNSTLYIEPKLSYEPGSTPEEEDLMDPDIPTNDASLVWIVGDDPPPDIYEDGKQRLTWNLYDYLNTFHGRRLFILTFQAEGTPGWGVHYVKPWFAFTEFTIETGETGALGVAIYNIIIEVEGVTYQVVVAYDNKGTPDPSDDEMVIISYQIVE